MRRDIVYVFIMYIWITLLIYNLMIRCYLEHRPNNKVNKQYLITSCISEFWDKKLSVSCCKNTFM